MFGRSKKINIPHSLNPIIMFTHQDVAIFFEALHKSDKIRNSTKLFALWWKFAIDSDEWLSLEEMAEQYECTERTIMRYLSELRTSGLIYERWHPEKSCKIYSPL